MEETPQEGEDLNDLNRRAADHARLDRRQQELTDQDLARIAQDVTRRYRPTTQKYTGDMNEIPQRLLMPSVQDANLWQVRVRVSHEMPVYATGSLIRIVAGKRTRNCFQPYAQGSGYRALCETSAYSFGI